MQLYAVDCLLRVVITVCSVLYFSVSLHQSSALSVYSTGMLYSVVLCMVGVDIAWLGGVYIFILCSRPAVCAGRSVTCLLHVCTICYNYYMYLNSKCM